MADSNDRFVRVPYELWDDTRLTGSEKLVMIALFRHQNWEQRRSWPSQELIAQECGLSRLWVRKILSELERRKYIVCEKGHGRNKQYAICPLPPPDVMETQLPIQDREQWKLSNHVMETQLPSNGNSVSSDGNSVSTNKIKNKITNKMNEQENTARARENVPAARSAAKAFDFDAEFAAFWNAYPKPKHPDKTPGRMRYEALRRKGVPAADLLSAAKNYAVAMRGTDPQYIKRCGTFLGPSDPWRDFLSTGSATEQREDPEESYMRDLRSAGMLTADEYENWRKKRYEAKRV